MTFEELQKGCPWLVEDDIPHCVAQSIPEPELLSLCSEASCAPWHFVKPLYEAQEKARGMLDSYLCKPPEDK